MDYFKQRRAFRKWKQTEGTVASGQNDVYRELLDYANDEGLLDGYFKLRNSALADWTGMTVQGVIKARNALIDKKLIEYIPGSKNKSEPWYKILPIKPLCYTDTPQSVHKVYNNQLTSRITAGSQPAEQPVEHGSLLVPDLDKTSTKNISREPPVDEQEFNELWDAYPRRSGRAKAHDAYMQARLAQEVTKDQVLTKINAYKAQIQAKNTGPAYIKTGGNWFDQKGWLDDYDTTPEPVATRHGQRAEPEPDWVKPGYERPKEAVSADTQQQLDEQLAQLRAQREQRQKESEQA